MKHSNRLNRFSLLEVLCVICIIMILLSLLYPSFVGSKQVAKIAVCSSNMKQLHYGFSQFEKNVRRLPPGGNRYDEFKGVPWAYDESISWDDRIAIYIGRELTNSEYLAWTVNKKSNADSMLHCPSDKKNDPVKLVRTYSVNAYGLWGVQSSQAAGYTIPSNSSTGIIGLMISRRSSEVEAAGQCFLLTEGFNVDREGDRQFAGNGWYSAFTIDLTFAPYEYHNGKRAALYIDGHAQIITNTDLLPGTDTFYQNISIR